MPGISVVIPYFQREAGHLRRAVRSALRQREIETPTVIVVDDGSPLPAQAELAELDAAEVKHVRLVLQSNKGPGPARNAGLDSIDRETEWIAFLDSDDVWEPGHLARGLTALREGFDFFFANLLRDGDADTHFGLAGFDVEAHQPLSAGSCLFTYVGDFFTSGLTYSPVGTSTVIIRRSALGALRFWRMRDTPGEDLLFWLDAARSTKRIAFDNTVQVRYGRGNVTHSDSWKSAHALRTNLGYATYIAEVAKRFLLDEQQAALVDRIRRENREAVAQITLAMLREGRLSDAAPLDAYVRRHPGLIADVVRVLGRAALGRMSRPGHAMS
jgi:succinoglycan biosynthesis protein ExoW